MKTIKWTNSKGNVIELTATIETKIVNETISDDGWVREIENKIEKISAELIATLDGKIIDTCRDVNFWEVITTPNGYKKIRGISTIGMTEEQGKLVTAFLNQAIESMKSEDNITNEKEIKNAKYIIEKAEAQSDIFTEKETIIYLKNYNNLYNEGGEGYLPTLITKEQYELAKSKLI